MVNDADTVDIDYFDLDKHRLDEELINQVKAYRAAAHTLAEARADTRRAEAALKVVEAEIGEDIRLHPSKYNTTKVTEGVVERLTVLQSAWQEANEKTIKARYEQDICEAEVRTLEHRKTSLEKLVELESRNYWAEPRARAPRERLQEAEMRQAFDKRRDRG